MFAQEKFGTSKWWLELPTPTIAELDFGNVLVGTHGANLSLNLRSGTNPMIPTLDRESLIQDNALLGLLSPSIISDLSKAVIFPPDFVTGKLPLALQAEVINARINSTLQQTGATKKKKVTEEELVTKMNFLGEGMKDELPTFFAMANPNRAVIPHAVLCQHVDTALHNILPGKTIVSAGENTRGSLTACWKTDVQIPITKALGDCMGFGIILKHRYATEIEIILYYERLVCLNGMTRQQTVKSWRCHADNQLEGQLGVVSLGIKNCFHTFITSTENMKKMAETVVPQDNIMALITQRAVAMGIPKSHHTGLYDAFQTEPIYTEYGLAQAATRYATHHLGVANPLRAGIMESVGGWCSNYDVVTARIPRKMAEQWKLEYEEVEEEEETTASTFRIPAIAA